MTDIMVFGTTDERTMQQALDVSSRALHVALMADNHLGYIMPIGGVASYDNQVSVAGVGFDIGCGNLALQLSVKWEEVADRASELADEIASSISFGVGRVNTTDDSALRDHDIFDDDHWHIVPAEHREALREKARAQLGTVGSGNHYVDIFEDENGWTWVGVHFGSRGLGHTIASNFMALAQGKPWGTRVQEAEALLSLDTDLGSGYWEMMELAGRYAKIGREWVALRVKDIIGAGAAQIVHNHHNFAWHEHHLIDGELRPVVVIRKGATPAWPGERGFVGGSMGDAAYIISGAYPSTEGTSLDLQRSALFSTVHGAGRVMSRSQAKGSRPKFNKETGERRQARKGQITRQMMSEWTRDRGVIVRGGDVDESPHCYRRLDDVLASQAGTINILHRLEPRIVVMAGANVRDPYKD